MASCIENHKSSDQVSNLIIVLVTALLEIINLYCPKLKSRNVYGLNNSYCNPPFWVTSLRRGLSGSSLRHGLSGSSLRRGLSGSSLRRGLSGSSLRHGLSGSTPTYDILSFLHMFRIKKVLIVVTSLPC